MLMLLFVVRTTSKPALSSASVTSDAFKLPDEARASKPRVIASAASCFVWVTRWRHQRARFSRCVRVVQPQSPRSPRSATHRCADGLPGRSTAGDACQSAVPCSVPENSVPAAPSRCSTHSTLYWSLSVRHQTHSKLAISFSRWPGGKSCSAKDRTPEVYFWRRARRR